MAIANHVSFRVCKYGFQTAPPYLGPVDVLLLVLLLLELEEVAVELLLEPLVGVVDAQLLERVALEVLKACGWHDSKVARMLVSCVRAARSSRRSNAM
jgi:hypothetical protein